MSRILAIDYGRKRTGLAVTDPLRIIATGLTTVPTHTLLNYLESYFQREQVGIVVLGLPKQLDGTPSENASHVKTFAQKFAQKFPNIPLEYYDERFTSVLAQRAILDSGLKRKDRQNKALVDEISATIILQSYLEHTKTSL